MNRASDVDDIARRVDAALQEPFALVGADEHLRLTATIGVVFSGYANEMSNALVVNAAKAMRQVKKARDPKQRIIDLHADLASHTTEARDRVT
jgi:GGDEF domain-containing protein